MSTLISMTGFGSANGEADWGSWSVEAKSVNGRGLDVRVSTPHGFDGLERVVKREASARFSRGNIQVAVRIETSNSGAGIQIDEAALGALIMRARQSSDVGELSSSAVAKLLAIKGIVETRTLDTRELAKQDGVAPTLEAGISTALGNLATARQDEGAALANVFGSLVAEFRATTTLAAKLAEDTPGQLQAKLISQLEAIEATDKLDADRLAAEIALSVTKADVREELDRLAAHLDQADTLLNAAEPVGRKLDFLSQEIGREANTLCSKSTTLELTNAGLALKALNDQFKEQAANVE